MENCKIRDNGLNHLYKGLMENYVLLTLNLSNNYITDEGAT